MLEKVGVQVPHPEVQRRFREAGASVEEASGQVRIPEAVEREIERVLASVRTELEDQGKTGSRAGRRCRRVGAGSPSTPLGMNRRLAYDRVISDGRHPRMTAARVQGASRRGARNRTGECCPEDFRVRLSGTDPAVVAGRGRGNGHHS
jgi:hypothetical protein